MIFSYQLARDGTFFIRSAGDSGKAALCYYLFSVQARDESRRYMFFRCSPGDILAADVHVAQYDATDETHLQTDIGKASMIQRGRAFFSPWYQKFLRAGDVSLMPSSSLRLLPIEDKAKLSQLEQLARATISQDMDWGVLTRKRTTVNQIRTLLEPFLTHVPIQDITWLGDRWQSRYIARNRLRRALRVSPRSKSTG